MNARFDAHTYDRPGSPVILIDETRNAATPITRDEARDLAAKLHEAAGGETPLSSTERVRLAAQMRSVLNNVPAPNNPATAYAVLYRALDAFSRLVMGLELDSVPLIAAVTMVAPL